MKYWLIFITSAFALNGWSQGCSDAGFCTAGSLNGYQSESNEFLNEVKLTLAYEIGEQRTSLFIPQLEGLFSLDEDNFIQLKIPYQIASGNLGTNSGLGDIIASFSHRFYAEKDLSFSGTLGARIAAGNSNDQIDGRPLPMPYQPSLGTYDAIIGFKFSYKTWILAGGAQVPMAQNNNNSYQPIDWPTESSYYLANSLERKADVMLRVEKAFKVNTGFIKLGVLPIYHIANDTYLDNMNPNTNPTRVEAEGSKGLTINLTAAARVRLKEHWAIDFAGGLPVMVRDNRPDGLTRSLVLRPTLVFRY